MRTTAAVRGGTCAITRAGEQVPAKEAPTRRLRWVWRAAVILFGIGLAARAVLAQQTPVPDQNHFVVILDTSGTTWRSLPESDFGDKRARMADLVAGSVFDALATRSGLLPPFRSGRDVISLLPVGLPQYASKDELHRPPSFRDSYVSDAYAQLRLRDRRQLRDAIRGLERWSYWSVIEAAVPLAVDFLGREQPPASMPRFRHTVLVVVSDRRLNKNLEETTDEIRHLEAANQRGFPDAEKIRDFDYLHGALAAFGKFWLSGVPQHSRYLVTTASLSVLIPDDGVTRWFSDAYPLKIYVTELLPAPRPQISFSQLFTPVHDVLLLRRAGQRYEQDLTVTPRPLTVDEITLSPLTLEWSLADVGNSIIASGSSRITHGSPAKIPLQVSGNAQPASLQLTGWFTYNVPSYRGQLVTVRQSVKAGKEADLMVAPGIAVSEEMMKRGGPDATQEEVRQAESLRVTRSRGILVGVIVAALFGIAVTLGGRYPRPKLIALAPDRIEPVNVSLDDPVRQPVVLGRIRIVNRRTKPFVHKGSITVQIHCTSPNDVARTGPFLALTEQGATTITLHTDGVSETLPLIAFPAALTDLRTPMLADTPAAVPFKCSLSWASDRKGSTKPFEVVALVRPRLCVLRAEFVPVVTAIEYDRDATVDLGSLRVIDESGGAFHIPFDCAVAITLRSGEREIAPIITPGPDAATFVVTGPQAAYGEAADAADRDPKSSIVNMTGSTPFGSATLTVSCRLKELAEPFHNPAPLVLNVLVRRGAQQLTVAENTASFTLHPNLQEPRLSIHLRTGTGLEVPLQRVPNGVVQTVDQFETIWIDPRLNQYQVLLAMIEVGNAARNGDGRLNVRVSINQLAEGQAPLVLREERDNQYNDSKLLGSEQTFQWNFKNSSNPARLSLFIDPSDLTPLQPATLTLKAVRLNIVAHSGASNDGESVALLLQPIRIGRMPRPEVVSLDFGTSAVAAMYGSVGDSRESAINLRQKEVLNQDTDDFAERGSNFIPSVIYAEGKDRLHFPATLAEFHSRPDRIIAFLKKFVASNVDRIVIEDTSYAVDDLLKFAYSSLLSDRGFLGSALDDGWWNRVQRIVLTHPNSFQLEHLTRFRKAINEARPQLRVVEFVPEADAVAYYAASRLLQNDDFRRKPSLLLLVYDIGAGTLDLALRRITKDERGHIQSISKVAENTINGAGNELDAAIARYVDDILRREVQDPAGKRAGLDYRFPLIGGPVGSKSDRRTRAAFLTDMAMAIAQFKREVSDQYEPSGATNSFELPLPVQSEQHLLSVPRGTSLGEYFSSRGSGHDVRFKGNRVNVLVKLDALEASDAMKRFIERHVDMALQSVLVVDHQASAGAEWPDAILFSGRTARWPAIQRHAQRWFEGRTVKGHPPPKVIEFSEPALLKESVARGAILWASRDSIRLEGRSDLPGIFGVVSRDRSGTFAWCPLFGGEAERYEISPDGARVPVFQGEALLQANPLVEVRIVCSYNRAPLYLVSQLNGGRVPLSILEDGIYFKTFETFDEQVIREQVVQERSQTLNVSVQTIYERSTRRIALRCDLGTRRGPLRSLVRDQTIRLEELWPYSELGTLVHQGSAP